MSERGAAEGGLRERKKRATRAALAEAAIRLAAEHGVDKVTVEAISAAAGVSERTFFNYFDTRDDAFVVIDSEATDRVRTALLAAPTELSPLEALRDALAAELAGAEQDHELWGLHAGVLRSAPHLLVRSLGAHMADETALAEAVAARLGTPVAVPDGAGPPGEEERRAALELYPRLLAALAHTAVRVGVEHWCSRREGDSFAEVFQQVFTLLAAGLPAPTR
ncbi:TetR/AcrR family transcriptional regulator [Streptomyces griseoaurantiacus]|uniref:TetR/AcrR family transcriptional regulator n=1 Tax=Streptomyces griseoaurantiacus TaxID=68213 RepID=UPI0036302F0C